uniref:Carbamoyl phosphate synthase small chain n=1 Tax=Rhodochaete parvula TaxID=110510 RepID=A0A1X9PV77_9RHOD|nr:carbamoyl phosphate synthase small subunit [Rhodochaete parvula]ASK39711.1 carbamoyl-phosphate synthase arginine-specific small subunit [Rhodochaete parvula]
MTKNLIPAVLVLEDGSFYKGWSNVLTGTTIGEVVFNTGMTGYQEILTDPSYSGQIVIFTYPEIGNTGVNFEDNESRSVNVKGIATKNIFCNSNNWRCSESISDYLQRSNILSISGVDTRSLTKHLRHFGAMNGAIISTQYLNPTILLDEIKQIPKMQGLDLILGNATKTAFSWKQDCNHIWNYSLSKYFISDKCFKVIVLDFGVKFNILRQLTFYGCSIIVVPPNTSAEDILNLSPDGILLSNGPGDPSVATYAVTTVQKLLETDIPILGICMGHQILSLALQANTFKLIFGHRGLNHPSGVLQKVEITSQNHGFAVDLISMKSFDYSGSLKITHLNLNDGTLAGLSHRLRPVFSVQYHPEASPGPHDSDYLFYSFVCLMRQFCLE